MTNTVTKATRKINNLHATEARWFAVYTGFRREKIALKLLQKKGIVSYLPLQLFTRNYSKKTKKVAIPLISCYVFVCITADQYVTVLETEYVLRFLKLRGDLIAIPEREINLLKQVVGELEIEVDTKSLHKGDEVEVIRGQLTGLRGVLEEKRGEHKLIISLDTLGYDLRIEVNPLHIRKV